MSDLESRVARFGLQVDKLDAWAGGDESTSEDFGGGPVRSPSRLIKQKDEEINDAADGVLSRSRSQADRAEYRAELAVVAAATAVAARDAINTTGLIAEDTADGIAKTTNGQRFSLLSPDARSWDVFKNVAGVAQYRASSYTAAYLDGMFDQGSFEGGVLHQWLDGARRRLAAIEADGTFIAKLGIDVGVSNGLTLTRLGNGRYRLSLGTGENTIPIGMCRIDGNEFNEEVLAQQLDAAGRLLWRVLTSGVFEVSSMRITKGALVLGDARIEVGIFNDDVMYQWLDRNGRTMFRVMMDGTFEAKIASPAELIAARGTAASLAQRLGIALRPDGFPSTPAYGLETLREWHRKLFYLLSRSAGDSFVAPNAYAVLQPAAVFNGDSWTDKKQHTWPLAKRLFAVYGRAGSGYAGVSSTEGGLALPDASCIDPTIGWTRTGTWVGVNFTVPSPNLRAWRTSEVGATAILSGSSDREVRLLGLSSDAALEYRYNDAGSWLPLSMAGPGATWLTLADPPAGAWTLKVRLVSGAWEHWGAALRNPGVPGLLLHKCGASSTYLAQWTAVDATIYGQAIAGLGTVDLVHNMWGINDQWQYNAATYIGHYTTMLARQRSAWPYAGVLISSPPESLNYPAATPNRVKDFDYACRPFAAANDAAHVSIQPFFGQRANYGQAGTQLFLDADPAHPSDKGIPALLAPIYAAISATSSIA